MTLRLGIIGSSEGNGHPYSWSAIFNGYDSAEMENCGYPVIPRYLEKQNWPTSQIGGAEVTAVWTQDIALSKHIAKAARIEQVVSCYADMIGQVDAILLARDDAHNHLRFAEPFLTAGLPIYIDKPIALSIDELNQLYALEQYPGQIFTCSALRYSAQLALSAADHQKLGNIKQIAAFTPKSWSKYAVHIVEPVLNMLSKEDEPIEMTVPITNRGDSSANLKVYWSSGIQTSFFALGEIQTPIFIRIFGTNTWKDFTFNDSFSAFKSALQAFIQGILDNKVMSDRAFNTKVVQILERGCQ
ncbi:Gfo/Idh/MocA family oxidoreductase [uncultured Psychrobacter sp.]|uniref:Gfo/Idh/MocA family oxidoreductase n=1 Tax=uncultured Psychrobacter sp. TaxID=259303 RepID=UPI00260F8250|nr:Gfo/Idh/MocA family oxidoreductase [uncultured Psychrobacter sp.]